MASRKDAIRAYKERTPDRGAYAIRCRPTSRAWVGATNNLGAAHNRTWFTLRLGQHRDQSMQADWNAHGEASFQFDVLEQVDEDVAPMGVDDALKRMLRDWAARLNAPTLLP
jgi:hypothetical protein